MAGEVLGGTWLLVRLLILAAVLSCHPPGLAGASMGGSPTPPYTHSALAPGGHPTAPGRAPSRQTGSLGVQGSSLGSSTRPWLPGTAMAPPPWPPPARAGSPIQPMEQHPRDRPSVLGAFGDSGTSSRKLGSVALASSSRGMPSCAIVCQHQGWPCWQGARHAGALPWVVAAGGAWPLWGPGAVPGQLRFAGRKRRSPPCGSGPGAAMLRPRCAAAPLGRTGCLSVPAAQPAQPRGCGSCALVSLHAHVSRSPCHHARVCSDPFVFKCLCPHIPKSPCPQIPLSPHPYIPRSPHLPVFQIPSSLCPHAHVTR